MHNQFLLCDFSSLFGRFAAIWDSLFLLKSLLPCGLHGWVTYREGGLTLMTLKFLWVGEKPTCISFLSRLHIASRQIRQRATLWETWHTELQNTTWNGLLLVTSYDIHFEPKVLWMSMGCSASGGHVDVNGLYSHWGLRWRLHLMLGQKIVLMSVSLLPLQTILRSVGLADIQDHMQIHDPWSCSW